MSHDKNIFRLVRQPLELRRLEVLRVVELTPRMRRITLGGPELEGFSSLAPEDHVKLFFPPPGEEMPVLPKLGPLGIVTSIGAKVKPIARDYTPRRYDPSARELDIDFLLHGHGVASSWAEQAAPGSKIGLGGPRGSYVLNRSFGWHLFVGDETAWPEFARRVEELEPGTASLIVALVNSEVDHQPLTPRGPSEVRWIHRDPGAADSSPLLIEALGGLDWPEGEGFVWLAGEAGEMRRIYRYVTGERGVPRAHVHASGHWKRGVSGHDHHEPLEGG